MTARTRFSAGALLSILSFLACGNSADAVAPQPPKTTDARILRSLADTTLVRSNRLLVAASSTTITGDRVVQLRIADTAVVAIDAVGVLTARRPGKTWLRWTLEGGNQDSASVRVIEIGLRSEDAGTWTAPRPLEKLVDVRWPAGSATRTTRVAAGQDLQDALDGAKPGDELVLARGAVFVGNFYLPKKPGVGWIVIRGDGTGTPPGTRMTPARAAGAAIVKSPNAQPAIRTAPGASRYRLVGFEVTQASGPPVHYGLVVLGAGDETALSQMPTDIVLDRMYIHGTTADEVTRCVAFNGAALAVIDSWLSECHARGYDAQAVAGWGGPGPFLIENNRLEGSGETIMFGGGDPLVSGVSPSDIVIRRNHIFKPMSWGGRRWMVKAAIEFKHAKRVLIEGNVIENHWADGQNGFAVLFNTVSQYGVAPWTSVQDVLIQDNIIKNSASGINLAARVAYSGELPLEGTRRIAVINNLFVQVGRDPVSGEQGIVYQLLGDMQDISIVNNTATLDGTARHAVAFDYQPQARLTLVNNVFPATTYGIFGSGAGTGSAALGRFAPAAVVTGNVLPNQLSAGYPGGNEFPAAPSTRPSWSSATAFCRAAAQTARPARGVFCRPLVERFVVVPPDSQ